VALGLRRWPGSGRLYGELLAKDPMMVHDHARWEPAPWLTVRLDEPFPALPEDLRAAIEHYPAVLALGGSNETSQRESLRRH
jgi:hypothetical protein